MWHGLRNVTDCHCNVARVRWQQLFLHWKPLLPARIFSFFGESASTMGHNFS
jgi:hypothetical protein